MHIWCDIPEKHSLQANFWAIDFDLCHQKRPKLDVKQRARGGAR